jgi:hypothetical protein
MELRRARSRPCTGDAHFYAAMQQSAKANLRGGFVQSKKPPAYGRIEYPYHKTIDFVFSQLRNIPQICAAHHKE